VGGAVRDLLLGRPNFDLDIVVESEAVRAARELAAKTGAKLTAHERFNTARLRFDSWIVDMATCRSETYTRPGALPSVRSGTLRDDLFRRDFTINAMAVRLTGPGHGELIDFYGGRNDLQAKLVRVLHDRSFVDDATRVWRAVRYEQRLGFSIEPHTLELLKRDIEYLNTVSGDRIRHELELVLAEKEPEKTLLRAGELGLLKRISPTLHPDAWMATTFKAARDLGAGHELAGLYFALLVCQADEAQLEQVISLLRPARRVAVVLRDAHQLKLRINELGQAGIRPSRVYSILHGYAPAAILANLIATDAEAVRGNIRLYLNSLRSVKPLLNGKTLQNLGIGLGPAMQEVLVLLHNAKLDGEVKTREDEERVVGEWINNQKVFKESNIQQMS
jgi:tRNA nucleotidyltransferase (CCA-adding enzyme)